MTGLGQVRLERRIAENQYLAHGLPPPSPATVRDYFLLRRTPTFDPDDNGIPPWLFAVELEFRGASFNFFHPLFDLLFGQLESSLPHLLRLARVPDAWIAQAAARGDQMLANEWTEFNAKLQPKRGRPSLRGSLDELSFIHLSLMRLGEPHFSCLFERKGLAPSFSRRYLTVEQEIDFLTNAPGMESLAVLVGLVHEAGEIGDMHRLHALRDALRAFVDQHGMPKLVDKVGADLWKMIDSEWCLKKTPRRYSATLYHGFGLPSTWRARLVPRWMEELHEQEQEQEPRNRNAG